MPILVQLVGRFSVFKDGSRLDDRALGSLKGRLLLKALVARRNHVVPPDELLEIVWGERPPSRPDENLAVLVSRLRSVLGAATIEGGRGGYLFRARSGCSVDLDEAEELIDEARSADARGDSIAARTAADAAVAILAAGDVLEDEPYAEWSMTARSSAQRLLREGLHLAATLALQRGDPSRALAAAERAVIADPLDERAHRTRMLALDRLGERARALTAYEDLRARLADELGTDPSAESEAIYLAILRSEPPPGAPAPATASGTPHGRETESAALDETWERVRAHGPEVVILRGEPGIGKTHLAEAFAARLESVGVLLLHGRCFEFGRSRMLQPVLDALGATLVRPNEQAALATLAGRHRSVLATLIPELQLWVDDRAEPYAEPETERHHAIEAVIMLLNELARQRPLLFILDDLHLADETTVEFLHRLARHRRAVPMLVLGLARQEDPRVLSPLAAIATTIDLGPLRPEAIARIAADAGLADAAERIAALSGGLPLYAVEALRALRETGSVGPTPSLAGAILDRVRRAGPEIEQLIRAAAVVGYGFEMSLVAELLECSLLRAVRLGEEALRRGLLRLEGSSYVFAHEIVRDTMYESLPAPTRTAWHRIVAARLRAADGDAEAIAFHASRAGDEQLAAGSFLEAGRRAAASFANRESQTLLDAAAGAAERAGDRSILNEVLLERAAVRMLLDDSPGAVSDLERVLDTVTAEKNAELQARTFELLGRSHYFARDLARADEAVERALALSPKAYSAFLLSARIRHARGDLAGAEQQVSAAVHSEDDQSLALSYLGSIKAHRDDYAEAVELLAEAERQARSAGRFRETFNSLFFRAHALGNRGDLSEALRCFQTLRAEGVEAGIGHYEARSLNGQAWMWLELGDPKRALDLTQEAAEKAPGPAYDEPRANALLIAADAFLALGDHERARAMLDEAEPIGVAAAFGWRFELRALELRARITSDADVASRLAELAQRRGAPKYHALALALQNRNDEAADEARRLGSDLLVAKVAPAEEAAGAMERLAGRLPVRLRERFLAHADAPPAR